MAEPVGRVGCFRALRPADDIELRRMRAQPYFRGKDVLDIGAGNGRLTWLIAPLARSVVGVDPDPEAVREARREARTRGVRNTRFLAAPAQKLGVANAVFDTAVFSWSL